MTAPISVGEVSVEVVASAKNLAKSIRKEVEDAFKGLDIQKLIRDSIGDTKIKLPVEPDFDTKGIPDKVKKTRVPKVPVEIDPLFAAFQQEIRRQTAALAKQVNVKIPVGGDTTGLREELGSQLKAVADQSRVKVPVEPGDKAELQSKLQTQLAEVAARLQAHVKVNADTTEIPQKVRAETEKIRAKVKVAPEIDRNAASGRAFSGLSNVFKSLVPDIGGAGAAVRSLAGGIGQFASVAAQGGSQLAGSISAAAGPIGTVISLLVSAGTAMGALGAAAVFVVPAITAVAGAAAAIPAALSGLGAAFGTLGLGFKGISDAFKPKSGSGGGGAGQNAAQQARQVAAASRSVEAARRGIAAANRGLEASERGLASAQRGVVQAQQAVTDAERGVVKAQQQVVDAQKRATAAQAAVNQARRDAVEDIEDLNRSLRGAKLSEEDAALGVTEALRALESAKVTGDIPSIQRADLAYRQSLQTLDEAKDTTDDLQKATDKANKAGVDGSDKVTDALRNQQDAYQGVKDAQEGVAQATRQVRDAQNGVIDATDSLKSAQDGVLSAQDGIKSATDGLKSAQDSLAQSQQRVAAGSAGVAQQITKLAPSAQRFVDAIKALKPAFEDLRLDVQQRLFEGLDRTVTNLGTAWIPALKTTLGSYADTFNQFFKNLGTSITTPKFITDIQAGAEGFRQGFEDIGTSITKSLVPAFGALTKAAGPFLAALGKEIAGIVTQFSNWVLQGEKTGGLTSFFDRAAKALHSIFTTGTLVGSIIGDLFSIITGAQGKSGQTPIDTFNNALSSLDKYLKDPQHQQQIRDFIQQLADTVNSFAGKIKKIDNFLEKLGLGDEDTQGAKDKSSSIGADIGRALVSGLLAGIVEGMKLSLEGMFYFFTGTDPKTFVGGLKEQFGIHSPSTLMAEIGHDVVDGFLKGIADKFRDLQTRAGQIRTAVTTALGNAATWLTTHGQNAAIGLGNGIAAQYKNLSVRAQGLRTTVSNALSSAGTWLYGHGQAVVGGLERGIQSVFRNLSGFADNIRFYVQNALSSAGDWLVSHGRAVVIGLTNGIIKQIPGLGSVLSYVTDFIRAHKGPIDKDRVLLTPAGEAIMDGLIGGISSKKPDLADELADLTSLVAGTTFSNLGVAADAAISSSLTVASKADRPLLQWAPGTTGDVILDAIRQKISIGYRGDVQAALGG